jgi:tetratricopeptide (TPR) repeat protein
MHSTRALLLLFALILPQSLPAHDSPEHVVEILTARMETVGERADLLWRRAAEYRALRDHTAAAKDLKRAIKLRSDYLPAYVDLSRVQMNLGHRRRALWTIERAMRLPQSEVGRAPLRMVKADVLSESGKLAEALGECDRALAEVAHGELDWYLTRSQIQCRLGRFNDAVEGLRRGFELTGSAVLEVECLDAMIDAGQFNEALQKVETGLSESRFRSSWLLRRARIRLGQGSIAGGHQDLAEAIVEMNRRLNPNHPESGLLSERGFAYALLGDVELARRDLQAAQHAGADAGMLRRLEVALAASR